MNERIETMKAELRARRAAAAQAAGTVAPTTPKQKVPLAERIGRGLARTKKAVVGSITGVSDTIDAIGTSYSYYSEVPEEEQCGKAALAAPQGKGRRTAAA
jgi:hypothetical protein